MHVEERETVSSIDGTRQPFLFARAIGDEPAPLLVALHSWSAPRHNQVRSLLPLAERQNWHLLLPEFRGPNLDTNPQCHEAAGSLQAMQDIVDAIEVVRAEYGVAEIFLGGGSGGGHMALMMAAYKPELWTAVSAWCPITDLAAWYGQNPRYSRHIAACCGGPPGASTEVDVEYRERSPIFHLTALARSTLFIHHGKHDTSVPCTHSLTLYNQLLAEFPEARVYLEIFEGKHEYRLGHAFTWFEEHLRPVVPGNELSPIGC
jgi:pimeloyl-ACP methyl ester carboxylesterase